MESTKSIIERRKLEEERKRKASAFLKPLKELWGPILEESFKKVRQGEW